MKSQEHLILNQADFHKLLALINGSSSETLDLLVEELSRASVVPDSELPPDVVAMNSKVNFVDLESGKKSEVVLVFPHETNIDEGKISVLTPVGSALIGLREGQEIEWPFPNGKVKRLKVISVKPQAA